MGVVLEKKKKTEGRENLKLCLQEGGRCRRLDVKILVMLLHTDK